MEVYFYPTGCGDAARMSFCGEQGDNYHIFIDGGFERTYRQLLEEEIRKIDLEQERIKLWIISHIHDDHIGGALSYIDALETDSAPDIVDQWWFQAPRPAKPMALKQPSSISEATSIRQGDRLTAYLSGRGVYENNDIICGSVIWIESLKITILSPGLQQLNNLRRKYADSSIPLEQTEIGNISEAKAAIPNDHYLTAEELWDRPFTQDQNIENGSSIAILTDYHDFKILWLADAHPTVIHKSLREMGYSKSSPLICDWVKVSHHGSSANNSSELFSLITCSNYVFSVNGSNTHGLPNKGAIINILKSRKNQDEQYHFHFTHDDPTLRSIFSSDGELVFERLNFRLHFPIGNNPIKITYP